MRRCAIALLAGVCLFAQAGLPYIFRRGPSGAPLKRNDFANVPLLLNQNFTPGFTNSDGKVAITPDSDVNGALNAAIATWNGVPSTAAQFAPVQSTTSSNSPNVIVMSDTPAIRSMLGPNLNANTLLATTSTAILYSQIFFNPVVVFSSTGAPNTFDLQATFTKQLGNALGVTNSAVFGSALFVFSGPNELSKQILSADDLAGVTALYPGPGSTSYGMLSGTLTLNGAPLRNALISAVDPNAGTALSVLTNPNDGTWTMVAPPGNYEVYAQPLVADPNQFGPAISPGLIGLTSRDTIDTNFQSTFLGGDSSPTMIAVSAGSSSDASFRRTLLTAMRPRRCWRWPRSLSGRRSP
jgi:hypothetical protein